MTKRFMHMTFSDYISHYFSFPEILFFLMVSTAVLAAAHAVLYLMSKRGCAGRNSLQAAGGESMPHERSAGGESMPHARSAGGESVPRARSAGGGSASVSRAAAAKEMLYQSEKYYELMFASTSILFFTGLYFLIGYRYFELSDDFYAIWDKYSDFLLLLFLFFSIMMIDFFDSFIIPLKEITAEEKGSLRMSSMIYMLVIFGYIKFIYNDNNYDSIIIYFLIMIIGRFVYFDASFKDFIKAMRYLAGTLPCLCMVLATTALMALYGFSSGYLLKGNGVVVSLWIAHLFLIIEIIPLFFVMRSKTRKTIRQHSRSGKRRRRSGMDEARSRRSGMDEDQSREAGMDEARSRRSGMNEDSYDEHFRNYK